ERPPFPCFMGRVSRRGRPEAHDLEGMLYWELHGAKLPSVLASSRVRRGPAPGLVGRERLPTCGRARRTAARPGTPRPVIGPHATAADADARGRAVEMECRP